MRKLLWLLILALAPCAWAATGDIVAARIVGATTTVSDATSACNTSGACNGWVLELDETVASWTATGEAYSLGIGANGSVNAAKIVVTVTSTGYDKTGTATTYVRTLYATHQLRKVYSAGYTPPYPNDETNVSTTLTMRFALGAAPKSVGDVPESGYIFTGDTSVSVNVAAGIYTYSSTPNNAATGLSVTNNSTLAFPKAIANWSRPGWQRIPGSTLTVAAVGCGQGAHDGRPLAAMIFTAADAHSHTATTTVTMPTIDFSQGDAVPVQEYIGTLNLSGFTQADLVTVNFKAVPWLGVTASIMDTSDGTYSQPTPLYAPTYYINDAAGTFGTAAAVVDGSAGNDSTCVAVSEATFNANPNSNAANTSPCLTANKAIVLIRAFNAANSSPSRTDEAGTVWMKSGTYTWTGASVAIGSNSGTNPSKVWLNVQPFPGVATSSVSITGITSTTYNDTGNSPLHIEGIGVNITSGAPTEIFHSVNGSATAYLWIDKCVLTMTSGSTLAYNYVSAYWTQDTAVNITAAAFAGYGAITSASIVRGNILSGMTTNPDVYTTLGNLFAPVSPNTTFSYRVPSTAVPVVNVQPIFAYNVTNNTANTGTAPLSFFETVSIGIGAAMVANVFEWNKSTTGAIIRIASDGSTNTPVPNVMLWYNTMSGQRINRCYDDSGLTPYFRYLWQEIGQAYEASAIKTDTFVTANAGRVGNWACIYGVGFYGIADMEVGYNSTTPVGSGADYKPEFTGLMSYFAVPNVNVQHANQPPGPTSNAALSFRLLTTGAFVNRQSWNGNAIGTGNGNYRLNSNSAAAHLMQSGGCVLPYDLDGQVRNCSGYGSAGAYEQARLLTGVTAF
jgi:hypothetical protein